MQNIKIEPNTGNRFLAGLIDYVIIYGLTFLYVFVLGEHDNSGGYYVDGLPALAPVAFWLILTVGLESGLGGTIGNTVFGLKAIPRNGIHRKLTFIESLKRHLLDPIDMSFLGLVGILTIENTKMHQRVGDLWAKTVVVRIKPVPHAEIK